MSRAKLIVVLALALALGKIQCLAACAAESCGSRKAAETSKLPPCHKQKHQQSNDTAKHAPAPCSKQMLMSSAASAPVAITHAAPAAIHSSEIQPVAAGVILDRSATIALTPSPPGRSTSVLRI